MPWKHLPFTFVMKVPASQSRFNPLMSRGCYLLEAATWVSSDVQELVPVHSMPLSPFL